MADDWRPKLTQIEDPIADDYWQYTFPPGKKHISRLTVGRPVHYPQGRCWYTPVMVEGYLPQVTPVFGEGPVDSLINAVMLLKKFNDEIGEAVSYGKRHTTAQKKSSRKPGGRTTQRTAPKKRSSSSSRSRRGT
jgi:hypothetical protein